MKTVLVPPKIIRARKDGSSDTYYIRRAIGKGGFSTVYEASRSKTDQLFAIKAMSLANLREKGLVRRQLDEITIQRSLNHPNILSAYDFFEDELNFYIILELCPYHSVHHLFKQRGRFSEVDTADIIEQVLEGVKYLHSKSVIHRDIKLQNLLIGADGKIKISDFGISTKLSSKVERCHTTCGTYGFMCPEMFEEANDGYSFESDIWSIGVCTFLLLTGQPPFLTKDKSKTEKQIRNGQYQIPPNVILSSASKDFIKIIFQTNPKFRPKIDDLLRHQFILNAKKTPHKYFFEALIESDKDRKQYQNQKQQEKLPNLFPQANGLAQSYNAQELQRQLEQKHAEHQQQDKLGQSYKYKRVKHKHSDKPKGKDQDQQNNFAQSTKPKKPDKNEKIELIPLKQEKKESNRKIDKEVNLKSDLTPLKQVMSAGIMQNQQEYQDKIRQSPVRKVNPPKTDTRDNKSQEKQNENDLSPLNKDKVENLPRKENSGKSELSPLNKEKVDYSPKVEKPEKIDLPPLKQVKFGEIYQKLQKDDESSSSSYDPQMNEKIYKVNQEQGNDEKGDKAEKWGRPLHNETFKKKRREAPEKNEKVKPQSLQSLPSYCVIRFCTKSKSGGLYYFMKNGQVGMISQDHQRLVLDPFGEFIQLWPRIETYMPVIVTPAEAEVDKNIRKLMKYAKAFKESNVQQLDLPLSKLPKGVPMRHVKYCLNNENGLMFRMDNRVIQVNFNDKSKLIVFWEQKSLISTHSLFDEGIFMTFESLKKSSNEGLKKKYEITKKMIETMCKGS